MTSFTSGLYMSWPSPAIPKIVNDKENYDISEAEATLFGTIPSIGLLFSSYVFSLICQKIGPKRTIMLVTVPQITSWILVATAKSVYVFHAARLLGGIADACLFCSLPMYIGEIATPKVRGRFGASLTLSIYYGILVTSVIGYFLSITLSAVISMIFPVLHLILFVFMPESPYFLIRKGNMEAAKKSLKWLRRKDDVDEEFEVLKLNVERQLSEVGTWKDLVSIRANRKSLYAGIFLRVFQQLAGIHCFLSYTELIFEKAGTKVAPYISAIIFDALMAVCTTAASLFLDRFGRKKCFKLSSILCAIVLFVQAIYFYIDDYHKEVDVSFLNLLPLIGLILYCITYSIGMALVPTIMMGELFSSSVKTKGLHILNIVFGVVASLITQIFYYLQLNFGLFGPFLLFAICCTISGCVTDFFVPETKGKTLEQIQQSWKKQEKKEQSST